MIILDKILIRAITHSYSYSYSYSLCLDNKFNFT